MAQEYDLAWDRATGLILVALSRSLVDMGHCIDRAGHSSVPVSCGLDTHRCMTADERPLFLFLWIWTWGLCDRDFALIQCHCNAVFFYFQ